MAAEGSSQTSDDWKVVFPVNTVYIPEELKKRAKTELSEDDEMRVNGLRLFRSKLKDEGEFRWQDDELFLLAFLRARKFDIKRAYSLMKSFYTVKSKYEELYYNFNINLVRRTLQQMKIGFLPYRDTDGSVILIYKVAPWDPHENSLGDILRAMTILLIIAIRSPATQIAGVKVIVDLSGFTFSHVPHASPTYLWLLTQALQNCFPARFRAIHVVNEGFVFSYVWVILKQFLSKKIKERWQFHGSNVKKLHKHISPSILPADYQGDLPPFDNSRNIKEIEECKLYVNELLAFGFEEYKPKDERRDSSGIVRRLSQSISAVRKNSAEGLVQIQRRLSQCFSHS